MITALAGGIGAARLLRGMVQVVEPSDLRVVINTGDDTELHGLRISPDIDTITYTLAGLSDEERGWGLAGESWTVMDELERIGGDTWFRLGDRDLATHLLRTARLAAGASLSEVTAGIAAARGVRVRLLPMSDSPVSTVLTLAQDAAANLAGDEISFQDYFVRHRHALRVRSVRYAGAGGASPAPGVLKALEDAARIVVCPSNPVLSIGPILAVDGVRQALARCRDQVWAVSPIVADAAIKGPADRLMAELGHEVSVLGVARMYAEIVGTLVVDEADRAHAAEIEACGVRCVVAPTVMHTPRHAAELSEILIYGRQQGMTGAGPA